MNGFVEWIAAEAEKENSAEGLLSIGVPEVPLGEAGLSQASSEGSWQDLPAHNFPGPLPEGEEWHESALDRNPDLWMYRSRTVALLRRYLRLSLETGRLPSVLGGEMFRAKITAYTTATFEDRVIFVHDVEGCLERLAPFDQKIISRIIFQEYDHEGGARVLHCTRRTVERRLPEVLDELSEDFLRVGMLMELPARRPRS
jgi:hypothetical protein